jgi:hypothetical protein|tara:strand:+ start:38 stop:244 length:207 start_codon:yes stop_codon:yes gene_type:complete
MSNRYGVGVWDLTYYKIDYETNEALYDDEGNVMLFKAPKQDVSSIAEGIDPDLLEPIVTEKDIVKEYT